MKTTGIIVLIVSVLSCAVGACLLAGAGGLFQFDANRRSTWISVTGTVTRMRTSTSTDSSGNTSNVYCPTIAYTTADGQELEVDTNECSFPPAFSNGDSVELLYNPADPSQAELKNGIRRAFTLGGLGVLGIAGLVCVVPSLVGMIVGLLLVLRRPKAGAAVAMPS